MKRTTRAGVIALCIGLCMAMVLVSEAPVAAHGESPATRAVRSQLQPAAILTVLSGEVLTRFAGNDFSSATDGSVLYVGSTVRTSVGARAVITLFEGSTVELEPASDITIDEATTRSGSTIVQLGQSLGRSWHVVTHLTTADSRYEVRTPAATASVRGTAFEVAVDDGVAGPTTTVTTTEGRVATADVGTSSEVLVTADQTTTVRSNSAPEPPRSSPDADRVVTVSAMSESSLVVDPFGRTNGFKDGKVFRQTPGAQVRVENGTVVVTLPNVPNGVFATTVAPSARASVEVSTTVTDKGEEPVTITNVVGAGSQSSTSGVELRSADGKSDVRPLTNDETHKLPDAKVSSETMSVDPVARSTYRAALTTQATSRVSLSGGKKIDADSQPATAPRRTPSPSPTRR